MQQRYCTSCWVYRLESATVASSRGPAFSSSSRASAAARCIRADTCVYRSWVIAVRVWPIISLTIFTGWLFDS